MRRPLLILTLALCPVSARALTLTPLVDDRSISQTSVCETGVCTITLQPPIPFGAWDDVVGGARQTSTVDELSMNGSGAALDDGQYGASSIFDVSFSIDEPAGYGLAGVVRTNQASPLDPPIASARLELFEVGVGTVVSFVGQAFPPTSFFVEGYLPAGEYFLRASAFGALGQAGLWNFRLDLSPVPEPPVGWPMGLGLPVLLVRLRRRVAQHP